MFKIGKYNNFSYELQNTFKLQFADETPIGEESLKKPFRDLLSAAIDKSRKTYEEINHGKKCKKETSELLKKLLYIGIGATVLGVGIFYLIPLGAAAAATTTTSAAAAAVSIDTLAAATTAAATVSVESSISLMSVLLADITPEVAKALIMFGVFQTINALPTCFWFWYISDTFYILKKK